MTGEMIFVSTLMRKQICLAPLWEIRFFRVHDHEKEDSP